MAFGVQDSFAVWSIGIASGGSLWPVTQRMSTARLAAQGIVTGIQDAMNLAWKLGRVLRGAPENLLDTYEDERRPKAAEVLKETDRTTRLLLAPDPITKLVGA